MNTTTFVRPSQKFRESQAERAAEDMISIVEAISMRAKRIAQIALGVSMPHQIAYLISLCIPHMHFNSITGIIEALGMVMLAVAAPVLSDLLILTCIDTIGAVAAARGSKIKAFCVMLLPISISGTVNFLAPAPPVIKVLAAFIVACIPAAVALKFVKTDFDKLEAIENELTAVSPVEAAAAQALADAAAQQAAAQAAADALAQQAAADAAARRKEIAAKANATKAANKAKAEAKAEAQRAARRQRAAAKKLEELAPTSPGHPAVILSAADKEALAQLMVKS